MILCQILVLFFSSLFSVWLGNYGAPNVSRWRFCVESWFCFLVLCFLSSKVIMVLPMCHSGGLLFKTPGCLFCLVWHLWCSQCVIEGFLIKSWFYIEAIWCFVQLGNYLTEKDRAGLEVIKLFSCSTQLNMKFQPLIFTKMLKNIDFSCFQTLRCCIYHANKC